MPEYYLTRLDEMTQAVDTFAAIETNADGSTGGSIRVPQNVSRIKKLLVALAVSAETATDSGGPVVLRLTGNGLQHGQQELTVGSLVALAMGTAATGVFASIPPTELHVDIPVIPGNEIGLAAALAGVDPGTPEIAVTLVFG